MWLPCLFYLYAEYIMRNARLDEAQARIKITGRNINSLRHAGGTTLMAESQDELKNLLMKESEKSGLKCQHLKNVEILKINIQKMKIMASSPITSW